MQPTTGAQPWPAPEDGYGSYSPPSPPSDQHTQAQAAQTQYTQDQYAQTQYGQGQYGHGQYAQDQAQTQYGQGQYAQGQYAQDQAQTQYGQGQYAQGQYAQGQAQTQYAQGQYAPGSFAPQDGAAGQAAALAAMPVSGMPAPAGLGDAQPANACLNCGHAWTGSQACTFCGQVWGLPRGIMLSSPGRRFGGYLLEGLLVVCTLGIGWLIWTLIVWAQGQTPAKQILGMRVVRLDTRVHAGWGRMFLRDFIGKSVVALTFGLFLIGGIVADCWLLWDKDKQELWDKIAGTVVVNDPEKLLVQ